MITRQELVDRARALPVSSVFEDALAEAESRLIGLCVKPRFGNRLWLPKGSRPDWVHDPAVIAEGVLPGQGAALVAELLLKACRIYELEAVPPGRVVAVLESFRSAMNGEVYLAVGRLHATQKGNKVLSSGPFALSVTAISDAELVRAELERLATSFAATEINNLKGGPKAVVVGGARDLPAIGWRRHVWAVLWSFGFRLDEVLEEPWRQIASVNHRLSQRSADLYVFLRGWMVDAAGDDRTDEFLDLVGGHPVVDTGASDTLDRALTSIRRALASEQGNAVKTGLSSSATRSEAGGSDAEAEFAPVSWMDFHENLDRLVGSNFEISDRARNGCIGCGYPDSARMWEHLRLLAEAAAAWAAADCSVGKSFAVWIREYNGLVVALFDHAITDAGEDKFTHNGIELSRLPHVQVDQAKAFTAVGRIHFALDSERRRIVVDHIGLKLLGRAAAT
jgi:hypothetical protein